MLLKFFNRLFDLTASHGLPPNPANFSNRHVRLAHCPLLSGLEPTGSVRVLGLRLYPIRRFKRKHEPSNPNVFNVILHGTLLEHRTHC